MGMTARVNTLVSLRVSRVNELLGIVTTGNTQRPLQVQLVDQLEAPSFLIFVSCPRNLKSRAWMMAAAANPNLYAASGARSAAAGYEAVRNSFNSTARTAAKCQALEAAKFHGPP